MAYAVISFEADKHGCGIHQWLVHDSDFREFSKVNRRAIAQETLLIVADSEHCPNCIRSIDLPHEVVHPPVIHPRVCTILQEDNIHLHPVAHLVQLFLLLGRHNSQDFRVHATA